MFCSAMVASAFSSMSEKNGAAELSFFIGKQLQQQGPVAHLVQAPVLVVSDHHLPPGTHEFHPKVLVTSVFGASDELLAEPICPWFVDHLG